MWYYFTLSSENKTFFFLLIINVYWPVDSESDVHFHRPKSENLDNLVKQKFSRSVVSELDRREWTPDLDSMGLITHKKCLSNIFHSHYPENSESLSSIGTKKGLKMFFFFIQENVFWPARS